MNELKSVIVTTKHRGVFWGRLVSSEEKDGNQSVTLANARNAIRWRTSKGLWELAQSGPNENSLIGSVAPRITLHDVTSVAECTDAATKAWETHA